MGFPQVELPEVMLKHTPTYLWEYVGQQKPNGKEGRRKKKKGGEKGDDGVSPMYHFPDHQSTDSGHQAVMS